MNSNIYNKFRVTEKLASQYTLSKRFDEPTYFSFKLVFGYDSDSVYNYAGNRALFDTMPHPLFRTNITSEIKSPTDATVTITEQNSYSAVRYLIDANEPTRAEMMNEFIEKFNDLQDNFPYYFQQIDGVSELLKIDPTKGQRISNDKKITITCLEGLDLRMSYLMNLYRKIAWDDVYQRWVLPDMMRYFTLKIYLGEFRTFHIPTNKVVERSVSGYGRPGEKAFDEPATVRVASPLSQPQNPTPNADLPLYLNILDDVLPTWEITCELCEFDITDIDFVHLSGLNVAGDPAQGAVKFGIKVGNIKEVQTYPVFRHRYLIDRKLNGLNRAQNAISTDESNSTKYLYPASLQIAQNRLGAETYHISGLSYNQYTNENKIGDAKNIVADPLPSSQLNSQFYDDKSGQETEFPVDNSRPETWTSNAISFGKSFASGFVNKVVDKAKITSIPKLGVSFSEIQTVLQSKNVISALGLIRKGVNEVVNAYGNAPSSLLDQPIKTDEIMRAFLLALSTSEATDDDTVLLQGAANQALSDRGIWEKIKDYSMATDLIGTGTSEVNTLRSIDQNSGKSLNTEKFKATSSALDVGVVFEMPPSSQATNSKLQK